MSEAPDAPPPNLAEALGWVGFELDDAGGSAVGRIRSLYVDAESGDPVWLMVTLGRQGVRKIAFRRDVAKTIAVPLRECAAMPGRVWAAQEREALRSAPAVDPSRPLLREHEATICTHYGIGERIGRHAEVAARNETSVTAQPA